MSARPDEDDDDDRPPQTGPSIPSIERLMLVVNEEYDGRRLDHFLRDMLSDRSRAQLQKHIDAGAITIGGDLPKRGAKTPVHTGDVVLYAPPPSPLIDLIPEAIPLSILFEDEHLVVVDKQADLVVHPALGHASGTLVNALLHHFGLDPSASIRPGIVHRLDRNTTGAIVIAKNERVHDALAELFHERRISKHYVAVTLGVPKPASATIETFYGRHPRDRKKFSSTVRSGKSAITAYRVREAFAGAALVDIVLHTGRTHQIRVHFADRGHPLIGDMTYGKQTAIVSFDRPALHAARIAFEHPITGLGVDITAPLPDDLLRLIEALRTHTKGSPKK